MRRNRIHDGKQSGVYVFKEGRGVIEDNEIFANAGVGIHVETNNEGGQPALRRGTDQQLPELAGAVDDAP